MTRARLASALAVAAAAAPGACSSFPTPSEQYACDTTADCAGGRTCERGYCIVGGEPPPPDAPHACTSWRARHFDPCAIPAPSPALALTAAGTYTFDTATGTLAGPGVSAAPANQVTPSGLLISIDALTVGDGATLRVIGPVPLVVASWEQIRIDAGGVVDASSTALAAGAGAGAGAAGCAAREAGAGTANTGGGSGGGGGGYGGAGGFGGNSNNRPGGAGGPRRRNLRRPSRAGALARRAATASSPAARAARAAARCS